MPPVRSILGFLMVGATVLFAGCGSSIPVQSAPTTEGGAEPETPAAGEVLFPVKDESTQKWGYVNGTGEWVIRPAFQLADAFGSDGYATARDEASSLSGVIDKTGAWAVPPRFKYLRHNAEMADMGLFMAQPEGDGEKAGFVDATGAWVIEPNLSADEIETVGEGLIATGCRYSSESECGLLDRTGQYVAGPGLGFYLSGDFTNGKVAACLQPGQCGIVDSSGSWVVSPTFSDLDSGPSGAKVLTASNDGDSYGLVDWSGKWIASDITDGYLLITDPNDPVYVGRHGDDYRYGFVDTQGSWVIKPTHDGDELSFFSEGLAPMVDSGKYGYVDTSGKWAIQPQFKVPKKSEATGSVVFESFYNGYARAADPESGLYGFIDRTGRWVVEPKYVVVGRLEAW